MRLWSLHPKYLDPQGLVALWRESLLAQAVLRGETKGYRNHPQLERFKNAAQPLDAISWYLKGIHEEAVMRGYAFDEGKIKPALNRQSLAVNTGQLQYERMHLLSKLKVRNHDLYLKWRNIEAMDAHPLFTIVEGDVEPWERP